MLFHMYFPTGSKLYSCQYSSFFTTPTCEGSFSSPQPLVPLPGSWSGWPTLQLLPLTRCAGGPMTSWSLCTTLSWSSVTTRSMTSDTSSLPSSHQQSTWSFGLVLLTTRPSKTIFGIWRKIIVRISLKINIFCWLFTWKCSSNIHPLILVLGKTERSYRYWQRRVEKRKVC